MRTTVNRGGCRSSGVVRHIFGCGVGAGNARCPTPQSDLGTGGDVVLVGRGGGHGGGGGGGGRGGFSRGGGGGGGHALRGGGGGGRYAYRGGGMAVVGMRIAAAERYAYGGGGKRYYGGGGNLTPTKTTATTTVTKTTATTTVTKTTAITTTIAGFTAGPTSHTAMAMADAVGSIATP